VALLVLFLQMLPGLGLGSTVQAIGQVRFTISSVVVIVRGRLVSIEVLHRGRTVRLREDDDAADDRQLRATDRRPDRARRRRRRLRHARPGRGADDARPGRGDETSRT